MMKIYIDSVARYDFSTQRKVPARLPQRSLGGYDKLLPLQKKAYLALAGKKHCLAIMPTGSGKSYVVASILGEKLDQDADHRLLIIVPQKAISDSFASAKPEKAIGIHNQITGKKLRFIPQHNFCALRGEKTPAKELESFLTNARNENIGDRVAICTHVTFNKVMETIDLDCFDNMTVVVDEAQHLASGEISSNQLSENIEYLMEETDCNVWLTTATPWRNDGRPLMKPNLMAQMERFYVPMDEYLEQIGLSIEFNFIRTMAEPHEVVLKLFKNVRQPTIVYIDPKHALDRTKLEVTDAIIDNLQQRWARMKINDLVRESGRANEFEAIGNDTDCVVALKTLIEGRNWLPAERAVVFGYRKSTVEIIQILGRLLRQYEGKRRVEFNMVLPLALDQTDKEKFRDTLNTYLKTLLAVTIVEDFIKPVELKFASKKQKKGSRPADDILQEAFGGDVTNYNCFRAEVMEDVFRFGCSLEGTAKEKNRQVREYLGRLIKRYQADKQYCVKPGFEAQLEERIWRMLMRKTIQLKKTGIDMSQIDFDLMDRDVFVLEGYQKYLSESVSVNTLKGLRDAMCYDRPFPETHPHLLEEWDWDKNDIDPWELTAGSEKKVWWKCRACLYDWVSTIKDRTYKKSGCPKCYGNILLTTNEFITKAKLIHKNRFDYSKTIYSGTDQKVIIICKIHGEFLQRPRCHLKGRESCGGCHGHNQFGFIQKAKQIHHDKYTYTKTKYVNSKTKVVITCSSHGDFRQTPNSHLNGSGCRTCWYEIFSKNNEKPIVFNGVSLTRKQWALKIGIKPETLTKRLCRGWPLKKALTP